jgi:low affinity Fe/Cu permease
MKKIYRHLERFFEKIASVATIILGNSITFTIALLLVILWFCNRDFANQDINDSFRDIIHGITFLSLFIIQKSFNRFSGSLHLKLNELVVSHSTANNSVINV